MTQSTREIQGIELSSLEKEALNNNEVKLLFNELSRQYDIKTKDYDIINAKKWEKDSSQVLFLVLGLNENKLKITFTKTKFHTSAFATVLEYNKDKKMLKAYVVDNNQVKNDAFLDYDDDKVKHIVEELDKRDIQEPMEANINWAPCVHGNWCGAGCSGPGAPIDGVDTQCKKHDQCYAARGYFACSCNNELIYNLAAYAYMGSEWANIIIATFKDMPCRSGI